MKKEGFWLDKFLMVIGALSIVFLIIVPTIIKLADNASKTQKICVPASGSDLEYTYSQLTFYETNVLSGTYTTGNKSVGDAYRCTVRDNISYVFNILEIGEDTVSLIMSTNYDNDTLSWCDSEGDNPRNNGCNADGLTNKLHYIRDVWFNLDKDQINLPTYDQIYNVNNSENITSSTWLYGNLNSKNNIMLPPGYWTSSADLTESDSAFSVGNFYQYFGSQYVTNDDYGIRPVITVAKSDIF